MPCIEEQRILVWCNSRKLKKVIPEAVFMAIKLNKEICLLGTHTSLPKKQELNNKIKAFGKTIKSNFPDLTVSTLILEGELKIHMKKLADEFNSILLCCDDTINREMKNAFYRSNFPFLIAKNTTKRNELYPNVIVPINHNKKVKDSSLWGSYMGRFNDSNLLLLIANEKRKKNQEFVKQTSCFIDRFYQQFKFQFKFVDGILSGKNIQQETNQHILPGDLIIYTLSRRPWPFKKRINDEFDSAIIKSETSVLIINPLKDMYILCN